MLNHTVKFGFNNNYVQFDQPFFNNQRGTYRFLGRRTGAPIADLQLGWIQNVNRQLGFNRNYWRQHAMGLFINDDWKVTRDLTMNLGMRWEVNRAPADKYDRLGVYDVTSRKLILASDENVPGNYQELLDRTGLADVITTAAAAGRPRSVIQTDWNNFSPRLGIAYRLTDNTVIRTGYGIFLAGDILNNLRNNPSNQFPFAVVQNFVGVAGRPNLVSLQSPFPDARERLAGTTTVRGYDLNPSTGYLQSWNFTVERALFGSTTLEMDYRGSKGTHLIRRYDFNQPYPVHPRGDDGDLLPERGVRGRGRHRQQPRRRLELPAEPCCALFFAIDPLGPSAGAIGVLPHPLAVHLTIHVWPLGNIAGREAVNPVAVALAVEVRPL